MNSPIALQLVHGHLHLSRELREARFRGAVSVGLAARGRDLLLIPLLGSSAGGLLLKLRNRRGDCAVAAHEFLHRHGVAHDAPRPLPARWDDDLGALVVPDLLASDEP